MIIDSHIHLHLDSATDDPDIGGKIIRDAMRCGIGACIASHVIAEPSCGGGAYPSSRHLREANSYAAEQARRNPGRLYFLVYLNPQNPDWEQELERGVGNGAVGVKLWISLKNPHGGLEETVAVLRRAAELGFPVLLHVFNRTGRQSAGGDRHDGICVALPHRSGVCHDRRAQRGKLAGVVRHVEILFSECVLGNRREQSRQGNGGRNSAELSAGTSALRFRRAGQSFHSSDMENHGELSVTCRP